MIDFFIPRFRHALWVLFLLAATRAPAAELTVAQWTDAPPTLTAEQLETAARAPETLALRPMPGRHLRQANHARSVWRLELKGAAQDQVLLIRNTLDATIWLYLPPDYVGFKIRAIDAEQVRRYSGGVIGFDLPDQAADARSVLWLELEQPRALSIELGLDSVQNLAPAQLKNARFLTSVMMLTLACVGIALCFYIVLREKLWLWYLLHILGFFVYAGTRSGELLSLLANLGLTALLPFFTGDMANLAIAIGVASSCFFVNRFISLSQLSLRSSATLRALGSLCFVLCIPLLINLALGTRWDLRWINVGFLLVMPCIVWVCVQQSMRGNRYALCFLLAYTPLLLFSLLEFANAAQLSTNVELGHRLTMAGLAIAGVVLSSGLASQVLQYRDERDQARVLTEQTVRHLASFDALTGLPKRSTLERNLKRALSRRRSNGFVALMFIDLDRFKRINDSLGFEAEDDVLRAVALRLTQSLRAGDTSARLAEDQFALLMEDLDSPEQAERAATRVLESLVAPLEFDTQEHLLSPCIGFAIYPTDADSVRALFEAADLALLMAKREGDIALRRYASDFRAQVQQRSQLEHALHKALAGEQFMLHFQPCLTLSGEIVGVEALLRWQHPTLGPIAPDRFIPILEQNGQITGVGLWVLDQALAALKAWDSAGLTVPWLSLNVSSVQLLKPDIAERFIEALERHQISGTRLVLELTESVVMRNAADAISKLKAMTEHGIRIAVDDFGTGYSSLAYLKRLPIHHLKIDKEFVLEIDHDADDQAIVRSILALAQALNLEVIAEGVETRAQWQKLADLGCSIAQGFYLGRPQCGADFLTYLRTPRSGLNH